MIEDKRKEFEEAKQKTLFPDDLGALVAEEAISAIERMVAEERIDDPMPYRDKMILVIDGKIFNFDLSITDVAGALEGCLLEIADYGIRELLFDPTK